MKWQRALTLALWLGAGWADRATAVIFLATTDPTHNTTTPGDNSGWQYEGKFMSFLGVPIAPHFFITAKHIGGSVGSVFDFHGDSYTTIGFHESPTSELRIWEVNHAKPFPTYAPLSSGTVDIGTTATVIGRGTRRGNEVVVAGETKGWLWGSGDGVQRWGHNSVVNTVDGGASYGELLYSTFDQTGFADECHLSGGDSGGGTFVLENGLWRLAGIHFAVDGSFRTGPSGTPFNAALYDIGGLEYENPPGWTSVPEQPADIPTGFYDSRIAAALTWIAAIAPESATLASEDYSAWQHLYFTPTQIATPATTGPLADFDGDGIRNLLEFALNLDPSYHETATMETTTGLRGLPLVRLETIGGNDHLTLEYVRRTATSGAGLSYVPEFSSDLTIWESPGTESVTAINPRWDRVKIVDALTTTDTPRRFARVRVTLAE